MATIGPRVGRCIQLAKRRRPVKKVLPILALALTTTAFLATAVQADEVANSTASEALSFVLEPTDQTPIAQTGNCWFQCDNGFSAEGWEDSCQSCLNIAAANCNQQGTYGGWMSYVGSPSCSYFW